jgi:hypothetical protein
MRGVRPDRTAAEAALDAMGKPDLVIVALSLAALSSPFGDLDISLLGVDLAETDRSLSEAVLSEFALVEADLIRHRLWSLPAMREGEEPGGLSWFAFGALVAHIYAADAACTSPRDGAMQTFRRLEDLLDYAEELLARYDLLPLLYDAVVDHSSDKFLALEAGVADGVKGLRELPKPD